MRGGARDRLVVSKVVGPPPVCSNMLEEASAVEWGLAVRAHNPTLASWPLAICSASRCMYSASHAAQRQAAAGIARQL